MAADPPLSYNMFVEVYFQATIVRGILETNQDRLSSYLAVRQGEEVFALKEATLEVPGHEQPAVATQDYLVYMREVFLIADLNIDNPGRRATLSGLYVKKDKSKALLAVGPYLLQGNVHLHSGSALQDWVMEQSHFLPITEATLRHRAGVGTHTYLISRAKIGFISALGEWLEL